MTHEDAGHYALKHKNAKLDKTIAAALSNKMIGNSITCAQAHSIASQLKVKPQEVGVAMDLMEIRIQGCQLGLFGKVKSKDSSAIDKEIKLKLLKEIEAALVSGSLPCASAWKVSKNLGVEKLVLSDLCNKMKIKISACQLGAFN